MQFANQRTILQLGKDHFAQSIVHVTAAAAAAAAAAAVNMTVFSRGLDVVVSPLAASSVHVA